MSAKYDQNPFFKSYKIMITHLLILCLTLPMLSGCATSKEPISKSGFYLNTVITITLYDTQNTQLIDDAFSLCSQYEDLLSRTLEGSDVWNINHSNGMPVTVSDETAFLLQTALSYCEKTDGRIDITLAPLSELWDFSSDKPKQVPSENAIRDLLQNVDYHALHLNGNEVTLTNKNAAIDLGFIAKGFIADKLKEFLLKKGVTSAIINLGGNVLTIGDKPDDTPFTIGIQKPFADRNTSLTTVSVSDSSVVSSGVYERYFEQDGKLYHHILDASTGYPYESDLLGVTILSKDSLQGDALSTSCFVLGLTDGMQLIESLPDVEAIFITTDYKLHYSSGCSPLE